MRPVPTIWVLVQTAPCFAVLATADSFDRLRREWDELAALHADRGSKVHALWAIQPVNHLVS